MSYHQLYLSNHYLQHKNLTNLRFVKGYYYYSTIHLNLRDMSNDSYYQQIN